jgi:para-aminobenzoate synthetase/4-amino-4-deoxychorismate lyase
LQPLLWFGLFDAPRELDSAAVGRWLETRIFGDYELGGLHWSLSQEDYLTAARRVKDYIAAGDVYQINLTLKGLFDFAGDPLALYRDLRRRQRVAHGALVVAPDFQVLSLSPELFLRVENGMAEARPMKGTAARGASPEEDAALGEWLSSDVKSRAENLMIVDLLRNDLGRPEPVSLRLDHRRAQVARHGDHPRARAGTAGRLHGRHRHAGTGRRCAVQRGDPYGLS